MKSRSIKVALLSAFALMSPLLTFAGDQPGQMHRYSKSEIENRDGVTQAVQRGKGAGVSRNQLVLRTNAYRSETAEESPALRNDSDVVGPSWGDSAFRK
jgi:hypothetical protein